MTEKHQEHEESLEEYAQGKLDAAFMDLHEELDRIENSCDSDATKILMRWVRDAVTRVSDLSRE
jgi:hypothetical protein